MIEYNFNDRSLIRQALTHSSLTSNYSKNYEKLEFLGDSILSFVITKFLMIKYKDQTHGDLSKKRARIINFRTLAKVATKLKLHKYIYKGKCLKLINDKILSDFYESLIGAIFIDSNLKNAEKFIHNTLFKNIEDYETEMNFKGTLIEYCLKKTLSEPIFQTEYIKQKNKFESKVKIGPNSSEYFGIGPSKKTAEKNAAEKALKDILSFK